MTCIAKLNGDPVNVVDPSGLFATTISLGIGNTISGILANARISVNLHFVAKASVGLLTAGLAGSSTHNILHNIAKYPAAKKQLELERTKTKARVVRKSKGRKILYHYTNRAAALAISAFGEMYTTPPYKGALGTSTPKPAGIYTSDIPPWNTQYTQKQLSALFYGGNQNKNVSWFVAIDGISFQPVYATPGEWYQPGLYPGSVSVDVITIGPNLMLP